MYPISVVQSEYSLWTRDPENDVLPTVRSLGVGFVACSPLGRGFLSGAIRSSGDLATDDLRITLSRLALAWTLSRGHDIVAIPGTKRRGYLEEDLAAADLELAEADLARIESAFPKGATAGQRYLDMSSVGV